MYDEMYFSSCFSTLFIAIGNTNVYENEKESMGYVECKRIQAI